MFAQGRKTEKRDPRDKLYLAFEGTVTEPQYFNGLVARVEHDVNVEIIPLSRGPCARGASNPKRIVEMVHDYREWIQNSNLSVDMLIELVLKDEQTYDSETCKELKEAIVRSGVTDGNRKWINDKQKALEICASVIRHNPKLEGRSSYGMPEDSKFFIIVDRDPDSFKNEQCIQVSALCDEYKFELIVSSPSFELWLLLHFDVKKEEILEEKTAKHLKRILDKRTMLKNDNSFFELYGGEMSNVLKRLRDDNYCEDLDKLLSETDCEGIIKDVNVGTNMKTLMDFIFKGDYTW